MSHRLLIAAIVAASALAGTTMPAAAQDDVAAGRRLAAQCSACHGMDGMSLRPDVPNIGGETALYLAKQLRAFRSGERHDETMSIIAGPLSDEDIANLAAYFSAIEIEVISVPE